MRTKDHDRTTVCVVHATPVDASFVTDFWFKLRASGSRFRVVDPHECGLASAVVLVLVDGARAASVTTIEGVLSAAGPAMACPRIVVVDAPLPAVHQALDGAALHSVCMLTSRCSPQQLAAAIEASALGDRYVQSELCRPAGVAAPTDRAFPALTSREVEVLTMIASGRTNGAIAGELFVSERTIRFHASNIFRKLGVQGRSGAIAYAAWAERPDRSVSTPAG